MNNIKILLLTSLIVFSCKKETTINKSNACNCYEIHEEMDVKLVNVSAQFYYKFAYKTTPQPDLCDKATGQYVYSGNVNQFRYIVKCN